MAKKFCVPYRGHAFSHGNFVTPASAMSRGIAVNRSGTTIAKAAAGSPPYGFLNTEVTTDGPSYEEKIHIPETIIYERKVSEGVVQVYAYDPGVEYVMRGNVKSGTTFAVGNYVYIAANGEFTNEAGASSGDVRIGKVEQISITYEGETDAVVWRALPDLGTKS